MLSVESVISLLNDSSFVAPLFLSKWRDIYYRMSLHTTGACPSFRNLRYEVKDNSPWNTGAWVGDTVNPIGWAGLRYDWIFDTFLLNRHPRENEVTRQWRKSQYKPYTQAPFQQMIDKAVGTIFADSNYSITCHDQEDNDYINGNNFHGKSLAGYFAEQTQAICEDPNGIFVTIPSEPYYDTTTQRIEPEVFFIPTRDIITITGDEIVFNLIDVAWCVNNIGYFRFQKDDNGKYFHIDEVYGGYFAHLIGDIPKEIAGGIWNTRGFYESYLKAAQAFADQFVSDRSAADLVNKDSTHPYVTMASVDCPTCDHTGKIQWCKTCQKTTDNCTCDGNGTWDLKSCSKCGGTGEISWNPAEMMIAPPKSMDNDLIKVVNPDISIPEYHKKNVEDCYNGIMRALHQMYIEQAQSGKAKEKDMEGSYLFMQKMSDGIFSVIEKVLVDILSLRSTSSANGKITIDASTYVIVKPTQFAIKTENDLLDEYSTCTEANIPDFVKGRQLQELIDKLYGGDATMKRKASLIIQLDPLAVTSESDKLAKVDGGAMSPRDWQFNTYLPAILDGIVRERGNEWFISAPYDQIKIMVDAAFKLIPEVELPQPIKLPSNKIPPLQQ